jgi:hypothetical protein
MRGRDHTRGLLLKGTPKSRPKPLKFRPAFGLLGRMGTTTPAGKAMFQMMGVFAEFARAMI